MKLSEAIRLGAMALPEHHGPVFDYDKNLNPCGACALGAALFAIGVKDGTAYWAGAGYPRVREALPLLYTKTTCPVWGVWGDMAATIVTLFEYHRWSREQIADWLETIEQQQEREALAVRVDAGQVPA